MKLICPETVWTVLDAESWQNKFENELCGKNPTKEKRTEFAKQNLGNTGRKNLNGTAIAFLVLCFLETSGEGKIPHPNFYF